MVGILILIHHDVFKLTLVVCADVLVFLEELHRHINDVIKIQGVVFLQPGLVAVIGPGNVQGS